MKRRRPPPSPDELRARAKRLADNVMASVPYADDDASSLWGIEDTETKAKRYVNAQCRARKAEIARGKVSTLSQGASAPPPTSDAARRPRRQGRPA